MLPVLDDNLITIILLVPNAKYKYDSALSSVKVFLEHELETEAIHAKDSSGFTFRTTVSPGEN